MSKEELQAKLANRDAENKGMVVYPEYFREKEAYAPRLHKEAGRNCKSGFYRCG